MMVVVVVVDVVPFGVVSFVSNIMLVIMSGC